MSIACVRSTQPLLVLVHTHESCDRPKPNEKGARKWCKSANDWMWQINAEMVDWPRCICLGSPHRYCHRLRNKHVLCIFPNGRTATSLILFFDNIEIITKNILFVLFSIRRRQLYSKSTFQRNVGKWIFSWLDSGHIIYQNRSILAHRWPHPISIKHLNKQQRYLPLDKLEQMQQPVIPLNSCVIIIINIKHKHIFSSGVHSTAFHITRCECKQQ